MSSIVNRFPGTIPDELKVRPHGFKRGGRIVANKHTMPLSSVSNTHYLLQDERISPERNAPVTAFRESNDLAFLITSNIHQITDMDYSATITNTNTSTGAATAQVLAWQPEDATPADVNLNGGYMFFHIPDYGSTKILPYNTSIADWQTAIDDIDPDLSGLTVGGQPFNTGGSGPLTITVPVKYGDLSIQLIAIDPTHAGGRATILAEMQTPYAANGSCILGPGPVIFERITLEFNDKQVEEMRGTQWLYMLMLTTHQERIYDLGKLIGYDFIRDKSTNFIDGGGGTLTIYVPVLNMLTMQEKFLPVLHPQTKTIVKVYFRGSSGAIFESGSGTTSTDDLELSSSYLYIRHKKYQSDMIRAILKVRGLEPITYRYHQHITTVLQTGSYTGGQQYPIKINKTGDLMEAMFILRSGSKTYASDYYKGYKLTDIEVRNENNTSLLGYDNITHDFMLSAVIPRTYPSVSKYILKHFNFYVWPVGAEILESKTSGSLSGAYQLKQTDEVRIKPTSTHSNAQIVMLYAIVRGIRVFPNGSVVET